MKPAVLLVGHGSRRNPDAGAALSEHAARLRERGLFREVRIAFLKEGASPVEVLVEMGAGEVIVVPMFASAGYYTEQVIPRDLSLDGEVTARGGQTIRYRPPIGGHPGIAGIIEDRARQAGAGPETGLVVLGHGTPRNPNSATNIHAQADRVRERGRFAEVCAAFIDQDPGIDGVWARTRAQSVVLVPLFMAAGWHVRETIPDDLALRGGRVERDGRTLHMTEPVGTHPAIAELVIDLCSSSW